MDRDRPVSLQSDFPQRLGDRRPAYRTISGRVEGGRISGWLVERSDSGFSLLISGKNIPRSGSRIVPDRPMPAIGWSRPVVVRRVTPVSDVLNLVTADFADKPASAGSMASFAVPTSRSVEEGVQVSCSDSFTDRRQFPRWKIDKELTWRVARGRKVRTSRVVERALDSLVLLTDPGDAPVLGTRVCPDSDETGDRFGFRQAVVRRTQTSPIGPSRTVLEIEA